MKASKFHEMSQQELLDQLKDLKTELFNLRFQLATGQLQNPVMIRECRRNIARVKTILREREIKAKAL
ncbi:MAG: 50S ribosomal protein L29 [Christensenellales bacterium]|jgi:large subunit ribosomal protein L29